MTRQEVINELQDICLVIDEDGELVAEDSLDALATKLMEEGSEDISEEELDVINEMIYDSFVEPETVCHELINMLMSSETKVEDIEDPLTADIWDDDYYANLTPDEVSALTADVNYSEFPDHHYQHEGCEGGDCKKELSEDVKTTPVAPELENKIKQLLGKYSNNIRVVKREDRDGITIDSVLKTPWHVEDPDETPHDEMVDVLKKNGFEVLIDTAGQAGSTWHSFIDIKEDLEEGCDGKECKEDIDIVGQKLSVDFRQSFAAICKEIESEFDDFITDYEVDNGQIIAKANRKVDRSDADKIAKAMSNTVICVKNNWDAIVANLNNQSITFYFKGKSVKQVGVEEAYYGKDSIIAGDLPSKTNTFYSLLVMRFNNMGYDEVSHPLIVGEYEWDWNPFGDDSLVMFGPSEEFFDKIVRYIESEVDNEGSAWYNRDYEVCQVEGSRAITKNFDPGYAGPWALCIEAKDYDRQIDDISEKPLPADIRAEYARRRKLRRGTKPAA